MNREDWLTARKLGVTGTDIAAVMGLNPHKSEDDVLLDKLGQGKPFFGNAATRAGQRLESPVANAWSQREQAILTNGEFTISSINPRYIGTPDFLTGFGNGLETKTGAWPTYKNGCPKMYELQSRWYMLITERPIWDLVACIVPKNREEIPLHENNEVLLDWVSQQPHREFRFERDSGWEEQMVAAAERLLARLDSLRGIQVQNQQGSGPPEPSGESAL